MKTLPRVSTVDDIRIIETRGPWPSKSGGFLNVLFQLGREDLEFFLGFDNPAFTEVEEATGVDIRGLRIYGVKDIPAGSVGANEMHFARNELVSAIAGCALWTCEDLDGNKRTITLDAKTSVISPAGLFHTYRATEDGTRLQVVCNTLFNPDDPRTQDSHGEERFRELQRIHQSTRDTNA